MKRIYLHVGIHKTGTTTIQRYCKINRGYLKKNESFYPKNQSSDHEIPTLIRQVRIQKLSKIIESLRVNRFQNILLNSEGMSRLGVENLTMLRDEPSMQFDSIRVVIFIRHQVGAIESLYTQLLKNDNITIPISEYCLRDFQKLNYLQYLDTLSSVFGKNQIQVFNFNQAKNELLKVFTESIGLNYNEELLKVPSRRNSVYVSTNSAWNEPILIQLYGITIMEYLSVIKLSKTTVTYAL